MGEIAKREWHRVVADLYHAGLLTAVDRAMLEGYCVHYERWVKAEQVVMKKGEVVKTVNGNLIHNPFLSVANRAHELYAAACREFGMTPASRSKVTAAPQEELSLAELLFEGSETVDDDDAPIETKDEQNGAG